MHAIQRPKLLFACEYAWGWFIYKAKLENFDEVSMMIPSPTCV